MTTVSSPPVVSESGEWNGKLRTTDGTVNYPLARVTVDVGRGRNNDIILDDPRVSRHHAQIRRRRGTFMIFDLDSANGTFVNGRPVEEAILSDGDRVSFGGVELVFTMHDA
jgi:pSer/pThr/pTyr-binding forkhead associated (FHA) protein